MSQIEIHKNILSLKDKFDIFLFDAYGVLWDGSDFYRGSKEALEHLVSSGKTVVIVSNATTSSAGAEKKYGAKGLVKGQHYNFIVTSGEMLNNYLVHNKIPEVNSLKKDGKLKVYIFGTSKSYPLRDENYDFIPGIEEVKNPKDADFIYITVPRMEKETYQDYISKNPNDKKYITAYSKNENGEIKQWEVTDISIFRDEISALSKIIIENNLLAINPNPDLFANSKDIENNIGIIAAREGSVAKELRKNGVTNIIEFGKPNKNIYEFTFDILKNNGIDIKNKRIAMVGDSLKTDICGANNAGVEAILCCKTGVTAGLICDGHSLEELVKNEGAKVNYFIDCIGEEK